MVIAEKTAAYVQISNKYILEAINRLERLSLVSDEAWDEERDKFERWCQDAVDDINRISSEVSEQMEAGLKKHMRLLALKAIEAEKDAAGEDSD